MLGKLKEDLKNKDMTFSEYFKGASELWIYFLKKEKKWIFLLFMLFFLNSFLKEPVVAYLSTCCLYGTYWVLYRKIIFFLTDKEKIDVKKAYFRSIPTAVILLMPIFGAMILSFYVPGIPRLEILVLPLFITLYEVIAIIVIYFLQVHMTKDMPLKEKIIYTYKLSKGNRWRYIACYVINRIIFYLIKTLIVFLVGIVLYFAYSDVSYFLGKAIIIESLFPALYTIFSLGLTSIIFVNVDYKFSKKIEEEEGRE